MSLRAIPALLLAACLGASACGGAPDPNLFVELKDLDAYWGVEPMSAGEQYIAPMVRINMRNKGAADLEFVRAMATFRLAGSDDAWGSDFKFVTQGGKPLQAGQSLLLEFKSEARYHSPEPPAAMFGNSQWKDARVEIYVRLASSQWIKMAEGPVARRVGPKAAQSDLTPAPVPSHN
jgi:hypothetical protein